MSLASILVFGFLLGLRHAFDADPLNSAPQTVRSALRFMPAQLARMAIDSWVEVPDYVRA